MGLVKARQCFSGVDSRELRNGQIPDEREQTGVRQVGEGEMRAAQLLTARRYSLAACWQERSLAPYDISEQ